MTVKPAVTVVVVSDYAGGETGAWEDLTRALAALAAQDFDGPAECLLVESTAAADAIPDTLTRTLPSLRILVSPQDSSYALKNDGVRHATGDLVALLDADCVPDPGWLARLVQTFAEHPAAAVVSGRTMYGGSTLVERILALLTRAYLDPGRPGTTRFISNNNAAYRREVFLAHPLPVDAGPFASRLQSEAILRAGGQLMFEPRMRVVHDFEGWRMERDIRRNIGHSTVFTRLRDPRLPYAWLARLGYASVPVFAVAKTLASWWDAVRCGAQYGVRWYELPAAFALAAVVHALEIPGMCSALRGQPVGPTAYR